MTDFQLKALFAGLCFGVWPLVMNKSGLSGSTSSIVLTIIVLVVVSAASYGEPIKVSGINWWVAIIASVISGAGLLMFNGGLATTTPQQVGIFFLTVLVAQMTVPAVYHVLQNGITFDKLLGFACAGLAVYFLSK